MITGDKGLGSSVENGPTTIGKDGVIQQGTPSGPPHEGSRETYEGRIVSVPKDYCATPQGSSVVIIGYKIWAFQREATNLADTVTQTSLRSHVKGSIIKHCYGDEKGTIGGVCSGTHNGECTPKTWSETVTFGGRNAVRDSDEWWMNNQNTWGVLDYKKDMNQYSTSDPEQVDARLYNAQYTGPSPAAAAVEGPLGAAAVAAPVAGRAVMAFGQGVYGMRPTSTDTLQSYLMRPYYNLTGGVPTPDSQASPVSPMSPAPAQPAATPPTPQATPLPPIPPTQQAPQQPTSTGTPAGQELPPPSPPPSEPVENTGPEISETLPPAKGGTPADTERTRKAKELGDKLSDDEVLKTDRNGVRISKKYRRPKFRKSTKDDIVKKFTKDGKLYDRDGNEIAPGQNWDIGHDPGYEFWKEQESAQARGLTSQQFTNEYNQLTGLSPEPSLANQGHSGEDITNAFKGHQ